MNEQTQRELWKDLPRDARLVSKTWKMKIQVLRMNGTYAKYQRIRYDGKPDQRCAVWYGSLPVKDWQLIGESLT